MPEFSLPRVGLGMTQEDLLNSVAQMRKQLYWLLQNLDSLNVKEINTNITRVKSEEGETYIDGPLLLMTDTNQLRLKMGYDESTENFTFEMYNSLGTQTMGIDSNGDATFTGTITGGTIRTALTGARIEISNNSLATYNSSNQFNGPAWGDAVTGYTFGDVFFYDSNEKVLEFYNNLIGQGYSIRPASTASLFLGKMNYNTYLEGNVILGQYGYAKIDGATDALGTLSQSDSIATTIDELRADFNSLLAKLRSMKILNST